MCANILSLAEVKDTYPVTYIPATSFTVHLPNHDIIFKRSGKHYIADWSDMYSAYAMKSIYTKISLSAEAELWISFYMWIFFYK